MWGSRRDVVPFKCLYRLPHWKSPSSLPHNAAVWSLGLVTLPSPMKMITTLGCTVLLLLLALGSCGSLQHKPVGEEVKPSDQPSKYGSLWPLPQKVQFSGASFKLTSGFRIVDGKVSYSGPSCVLLQDAYRRWGLSGCVCVCFKAWCPVSTFSFSVWTKQDIVVHSRTACRKHLYDLSAFRSTDITTTYLALLKSRGWRGAGDPLTIPPSWRSCRCGSHHLTLNVTGIPV